MYPLADYVAATPAAACRFDASISLSPVQYFPYFATIKGGAL